MGVYGKGGHYNQGTLWVGVQQWQSQAQQKGTSVPLNGVWWVHKPLTNLSETDKFCSEFSFWLGPFQVPTVFSRMLIMNYFSSKTLNSETLYD